MKTTATILLAAMGTTLAGTPADAILETPARPASSWEFHTSLYGWLTGLDGNTGVGPLTADVDASFSDILEQLEMAAALRFEARNGRWGLIADGFYCELGASGPTPGPIYDNVDVGMKQFIGELSLAYRVYETSNMSVDLYAGMRYNSLSIDFEGDLDLAGIQAVSENASDRVADAIRQRAGALAQSRTAEFQSGTSADRAAIEAALTARIEAEADGQIKKDLAKQLISIRRDGGLDVRDIVAARINLTVKKQRLELARSAARLAIAKLRASNDGSLKAAVEAARAKVQQAEGNLAASINKQLVNRVPTEASADKDWLDPIVGVRAQWNINDKFFLAGKSDIGGFGAGSDLAWTLQATVGYNFTNTISAELGYRYLHTDYSDDNFTYDIAQAGVFTSLNFKF